MLRSEPEMKLIYKGLDVSRLLIRAYRVALAMVSCGSPLSQTLALNYPCLNLGAKPGPGGSVQGKTFPTWALEPGGIKGRFRGKGERGRFPFSQSQKGLGKGAFQNGAPRLGKRIFKDRRPTGFGALWGFLRGQDGKRVGGAYSCKLLQGPGV